MRVMLVAPGLEPGRLFLQPQRTLLEMGRQLLERGHDVVIVSDGSRTLPAESSIGRLRVRRLESVLHFRGRQVSRVASAVAREEPDVVLVHLGLAALAHQGLSSSLEAPVVGVVTSPAHSVGDLLRLGPQVVPSNADLVAFHLAGALVPAGAVRHAFNGRGLRAAITLSEATRRLLVAKGAPGASVHVVPPGIDRAWLARAAHDGAGRSRTRRLLGLGDGDFVVCYFGSPAPTRGVFTLLDAAERAARAAPHLRLVILSRRRENEWRNEAIRLRRLVEHRGLGRVVRVVDGVLGQPELVDHVASSDLVCLPFELLPSDVPLSVLEAMALGRAVVTTSIASLPELVADDRGFLVPPRSVSSLVGRLLAAAGDPGLAAERGARARAYVGRHRTWDTMGQALDQVLRASTGR